VESVEHINDDDLERYVMRTLPVPARLDEHLLICDACRDRLKATEET
jgi:hypothetical protein